MTYQPPPPPPPYGPRPPHQQYPPANPVMGEAAGLIRAGKVAVWVWIALAVVPILGILACCGLCGLGGVIGAGSPSPTP